jgi:hypothetical protein
MTEANNLSVKLLTTIGTTLENQSQKRVIGNLKDLSNRIKVANKGHEAKHPMRFETEEWIRSQGINLSEVKEQAREIGEQERKMTILQRREEEAEEKPNPLAISFKGLEFDQLAFKAEENLAYRGIMLSLNNPAS